MNTFTELAPLIVFFITYKYYGLVSATLAIVIVTLITTVARYFIFKKLSIMPLITASVLAIFGGITVLTGNTAFIKIKPTIINLVFSLVLLIGAYLNKGLLKYLFENKLKMSDKNWKIFSIRWGIFFLFLAGMNEFIWRNFSESIWVNFKVFGMISITTVFLITQIPFIVKNEIKKEK